jgi:hypothetical protein
LVLVESLNPFDLGKNHQVLAYGYDLDEDSGGLSVRVYDPNHPGHDNVLLSLILLDRDDLSLVTFLANPDFRRFLRARYTQVNPMAALATV